MRSFIGIDLPNDVKEDIYRLKETLNPHALKGRWTSKYNYHLNLKFLGEISDGQRQLVEEKLTEVTQKTPPFELILHSVGAYGLDPKLTPNGMCGMKTLWIGVHGDTQALKALQYDIEMALIRHGFSANLRGYVPHIALGEQMVFNCDFRHIRKAVSQLNKRIVIDAASLFKSEHEGIRRIYTPLSAHALKGDPVDGAH